MDKKKSIQKLRDKCMDLVSHEDIRMYVRESLKPVANIIYSEVYVYVWLICMYNMFLVFVTLANLFIVQRMLQKMNCISVPNTPSM